MFSDNLNYIVEGPTLQRFYLLNNTLYKEYISNNQNKKPETIRTDVFNYAVNKDSADVIHIIIIDIMGRLFHILNENNEWKERKIENANLKPYIVNNLNLYIEPYDPFNANLILILSNKKSNNLWSIMHYSINKTSWSCKKIDEFWALKHDATIKTDVDNKGNIHLVYKTETENNYTLFYRLYSTERDKWNYPEKLCSNSEISNIRILWDSNNYVNVVWSELRNSNIVINYFKKNVSSSNPYGWKKCKSLSFNNSIFINPILLQRNNYLLLIWKQDTKFFGIKTKINENNWTDIETIDKINHLELAPICYVGNSYKEYEFVKIPFTYFWSNNKEIFLLGFDTKILDTNISNSSKNEKPSYSSFDEYMNSVDMSFKNINNNIEKGDLDMDEFTIKLMDLYYEIEDLKNKELMLYNSLFKIRSQHISLYEKIEDILEDYKKIK